MPGSSRKSAIGLRRRAAGSAAAVGVGLSPRFGPYGETLVAPVPAASAAPMYGWKLSERHETLQGTSSVSLLGARPYFPAAGEFLAPDPLVDAGTNLYSYTPADPINGVDSTGQANEWSWFWQVLSVVLVVAAGGERAAGELEQAAAPQPPVGLPPERETGAGPELGAEQPEGEVGVRHERAAGVGRDREARGHRQADPGHLGQIGPLAAEQVLIAACGFIPVRNTPAKAVDKLRHASSQFGRGGRRITPAASPFNP